MNAQMYILFRLNTNEKSHNNQLKHLYSQNYLFTFSFSINILPDFTKKADV